MSAHPILVNGKWQPSNGREAFHAENPANGEVLSDRYPVSDWKDMDLTLQAAAEAAPKVAANAAGVAAFLNKFAAKIEARAAELVAIEE